MEKHILDFILHFFGAALLLASIADWRHQERTKNVQIPPATLTLLTASVAIALLLA